MAEPAEDAIFRHLIEALDRLQEDLDRVELWSSALDHFHHPVPQHRPSDTHLLPYLLPIARRRARDADGITRRFARRFSRVVLAALEEADSGLNRGLVRHPAEP